MATGGVAQMGRMKDQLLDRPPTISDYRRQGVVAIEVRCQRPCKRIGRVALATLRLPDDTIFRQIPKLRRLRCSQCDRLVADVSPIFPPQEPPKLGEQRQAQWVVVTREADGRGGFSSPLWSREHALRFAKEQVDLRNEALRIEGPSQIIDAGEIAAWCASGGRT